MYGIDNQDVILFETASSAFFETKNIIKNVIRMLAH